MARSVKPDVIPEGMRWDQCTGRLKPIDNHKVTCVDSGWPETHVHDLPVHSRKTLA